QSMPAPRDFQATPKYGLNYKDETVSIPVQHHIQRGRLNIAEAFVLPAKSDFSGITFQWLNFREYWEIKPEPLMVFASNGDLREGPRFPNGFYYILADDNWETDTPQITAKYRCSNLNNYTVYEFNGVESSLEFLNDKGERARLGFTRYRGISLAGVQYLPGVKQDGLPVARGRPKIIIDRELVDRELREATFTLDYNGGRFHTASLASVCTAEKEESANYEITLADFVPEGDLGNWQVLGVEIGCGRSEPLFKEEFCLVTAFSVTLDDGLLKVTVPKRSVLKGETVRQSAKTYWLSCQGKKTGTFEVFFNKIGWKEFAAKVPRGKWQLVAKSNVILPSPLTVLQWESQDLGDVTLVFETLDPLVKKVVVSDDSDHLVMQLNVPRGNLEIPLENFADLYEELETKSKIELYLEGPLGRSGPECVAEVFAGIDVEDVSLFIAEQEDEYVLEVAFKTNYPKLNRLCFRGSTDNGEVLFQRPLRINPDYFYFKKDEFEALVLQAQIYYTKEITSIFGAVQEEVICYEGNIHLPNVQAVYKRMQKEGLLLTGFTYQDRHYNLPAPYRIENIAVSSRNFAGEELLNGTLSHKDKVAKVYFYVEYKDEKPIISVLWDEEDDALQYDTREGSLFWEVRAGGHIIGPIENLEFQFSESDLK
ncbi:MAG TPA: hypothetical protein GX528_04845, partial [Firmicutes bacterium]|nr:hypothetical protein [Bacillota bacterium]